MAFLFSQAVNKMDETELKLLSCCKTATTMSWKVVRCSVDLGQLKTQLIRLQELMINIFISDNMQPIINITF